MLFADTINLFNKVTANLFIFILSTLCLSIQFHYRVISDNFFVIIFSILGEALFFVWLVIFFDSLLGILSEIFPLNIFFLAVKIFAIIFMVPLMLLSGVLLANGVFSTAPVTKETGHIISISRVWVPIVDLSYGWMDLKTDKAKKQGWKLLLRAREYREFWAGEDIKLSLRRGILGLTQVVEIDRDMEKYYKSILEVSPQSSAALEGLINLYESEDQLDRLIEEGRKYRALYPSDSVLISDIGGKLAVSGRYREAIEFLEAAVANKDDYEAYRLLGWALSYPGIDRNRAKEALLKAIEINPYDWRAYYNLGYTYRGLGDCVNEKKMWKKVLEMQPNFPEVKNLQSQCKCNDD